ncbi:MAG: DUF4383 domain-containing protein, partial [Chloroflexi bacterium]|nr:DUF4383 domain-containing protein [Chloroflexota bacterium]
IFGIVYLLLSVFGFLQVGAAPSALALNAPDNLLHLVVGLLAAYVGFLSPSAREAEG